MSVTLDRLSASLADRYRIDRELGQGGMATVYRARDLRHDREVAIKVLHPDLGAALGGDRFLAEIRTTARLQHPHILPLLDSGDAGGLLYYVMPLVTGETLRARLTRERQLPVEDAVRTAREVADALGYAHAAGIIHRDIKPENILLQGGHALVADFGIALAVQSAGGARMTQTGLSLGTPQYMSPEQATGERSIDARSDIYALGAVTYEMLCGEPPFTGPTIQAIVARLMTEEPRALASQRKAIPETVEAAVLRALEKLPADRFATAAEFAAALDARGPTSSRTAASRAASRAPARWPLVTLGAVAIASLVTAAWAWLRPGPTHEVVRYRILVDSVPAAKDWFGEVTISPDGRTIVRSGGPEGTLLIRRRDEIGFTPLAGTEGASGPFFSADGSQLGYNANGVLFAIPMAGGPPVTIGDSVPIPRAVAWAPDGYLYSSLLGSGSEALVRVRARAGSPPEQLSTVDTSAGELSHLHPQLLPDGKHLVFQVGFRDGKRKIGIQAIGEPRHSILMDGIRARPAGDHHLLYTTGDGKLWAVAFDAGSGTTSGSAVQVGDRIPNTMVGPIDFDISSTGTLVYSVEDAGSRRELAWVSRNGLRTRFDSTWKREFSNPILSPDGSQLAVVVREGTQTDVWLRPTAGGTPARLTSQHSSNVEPAWSPDGRFVTYLASSGDANTGDVWRQPADGGGQGIRLFHSPRPLSQQTWAPDGSLLVRTTTGTAGAGDILLVHPDRDSVLAPLVSTSRAEYSPVVSPNGKWVAYMSNESGRFEVYVAPFPNPGGARWTVSPAGGSSPLWSHRGDELFFLDTRSNMVAARVNTSPSFSVENVRVLFNAADYVQTSLSRRNYDVSADDQRFLMVQRADGQKGGQVVVVEHWLDELLRKPRP